MLTFSFICPKVQLKSQDEFAIFQQLKFHKHLSIFENNRSVKSVSMQNSFCSLQLLPKHVVQTNKVFPFIFMCDYTYILILKGIVSSDQLIGVRYHLVVAFCIIILTVYSTGCYDKCFKNVEHQKLFSGTIYGAPNRVNKKYMVLFPRISSIR